MLHMKNVLFLLGLLGLAVTGQACSTDNDCPDPSNHVCVRRVGTNVNTCVVLPPVI